MATPITYHKIQTHKGTIDVPIYNVSDVSDSSLRVQTHKGIGSYDLINPTVGTFLRVMTQKGIRGVNLDVNTPSLIDSNGGNPLDDGITILENTPEYYRIETRWSGTAILFDVAPLSPNTEYKLTATIEIISSSAGQTLSAGIYNNTKNGWLANLIVQSTAVIGTQQVLSGTFNSGTVSPSDSLDLGFFPGGTDGTTTFKLYKAGLTLTLFV